MWNNIRDDSQILALGNSKNISLYFTTIVWGWTPFLSVMSVFLISHLIEVESQGSESKIKNGRKRECVRDKEEKSEEKYY